jgi:predicted deacetylase
MKKETLVISLHDVSPHTQKIVMEQLKELRALGVFRCSLLVIPDYHHQGSITRFPDFITWLQEQGAQGHEIILHGYYHLRPPSAHDHGVKRWITKYYTAGEGEFYDLDYEQARSTLQRGKEALQQAGFDSTKLVGFIAPAWLLSQEAERAVADEGFFYTTRLHGVVDLRKQPSPFFPSQSMVYSVRSAWRRVVSLAWNELIFQNATRKKWPLLRIGFHPVDWNYPRIKSHLLASVRRSLLTRTTMTYEAWLRQSVKGEE